MTNFVPRDLGFSASIDMFDKRTPEQKAAATAEWQAKRAADRELWAAAKPQLDATTDPVARAVLDHHAPDAHGDCRGCDVFGYEAEPNQYPCSTILVVARALGIPVPEQDDYL